MAQVNSQARPQAQAEAQSQVEIPFSLAPSIFTPFPGLSNDPTPAEREDQLIKILQNLQRQQDGVRQNMIGLLQSRGKFLVRKAEEELADLEEKKSWVPEGELLVSDDEREREKWRASRDEKASLREMMHKVMTKARNGAKGEEYEVKRIQASNPTPVIPEEVKMGGNHARNAVQIRSALNHDLLDLVERGVTQLEAYDLHASKTTDFYKHALGRCKRRSGSMTGTSPPMTTAGILKNAREQNPANVQATRRVSTGNFSTGLSPVQGQPGRTLEKS